MLQCNQLINIINTSVTMNIERTRIFLSRFFVNVTHSRDPQKEMQNINRKQTIGYVLNLEYTKKKDQQFSLSHSVYSKFFRKLFMLREKDCTKTLHALNIPTIRMRIFFGHLHSRWFSTTFEHISQYKLKHSEIYFDLFSGAR